MIDLIKLCYFLLVSDMADIVILYSMADIVVLLYKIATVVLYIYGGIGKKNPFSLKFHFLRWIPFVYSYSIFKVVFTVIAENSGPCMYILVVNGGMVFRVHNFYNKPCYKKINNHSLVKCGYQAVIFHYNQMVSKYFTVRGSNEIWSSKVFLLVDNTHKGLGGIVMGYIPSVSGW